MNPLICDLCGLSVLLLLVQVLMPALPLCIDQLYSDGNMSDHQSKQMHGIKQNADVTVFCPAFSLGTACVRELPSQVLEFVRERKTLHDWVSCRPEK